MAYELRAKRPDLHILSNIHERAIAEAAKRRTSSEAGAEEALRLWWASYVDCMVCYRVAQAIIYAYSSRLHGFIETQRRALGAAVILVSTFSKKRPRER